ncbi:hypothetical protein BESB_055080 [Besnoitia besnoiti]|uniref:GIY-YIG domain-containing protein n=1 Tax=Besnoitia besnoiti TaxID=94643 RepID=A0A2A9MJT1_BESBE|nr:hypothetical protein BESB_055080 [Besnoitia besnoiti]PFH35857.1 hypothetical protein BESB_055080 [Besnoitia besnoiti]
MRFAVEEDTEDARTGRRLGLAGGDRGRLPWREGEGLAASQGCSSQALAPAASGAYPCGAHEFPFSPSSRLPFRQNSQQPLSQVSSEGRLDPAGALQAALPLAGVSAGALGAAELEEIPGDMHSDASQSRPGRPVLKATGLYGEGFHCVYLLRSLKNSRYTYVGYSVHPLNRLKQHNGDIAHGGAWKTKKNRPWYLVLVVHGFPTAVAALQFEWRWQRAAPALDFLPRSAAPAGSQDRARASQRPRALSSQKGRQRAVASSGGDKKAEPASRRRGDETPTHTAAAAREGLNRAQVNRPRGVAPQHAASAPSSASSCVSLSGVPSSFSASRPLSFSSALRGPPSSLLKDEPSRAAGDAGARRKATTEGPGAPAPDSGRQPSCGGLDFARSGAGAEAREREGPRQTEEAPANQRNLDEDEPLQSEPPQRRRRKRQLLLAQLERQRAQEKEASLQHTSRRAVPACHQKTYTLSRTGGVVVRVGQRLRALLALLQAAPFCRMPLSIHVVDGSVAAPFFRSVLLQRAELASDRRHASAPESLAHSGAAAASPPPAALTRDEARTGESPEAAGATLAARKAAGLWLAPHVSVSFGAAELLLPLVVASGKRKAGPGEGATAQATEGKNQGLEERHCDGADTRRSDAATRAAPRDSEEGTPADRHKQGDSQPVSEGQEGRSASETDSQAREDWDETSLDAKGREAHSMNVDDESSARPFASVHAETSPREDISAARGRRCGGKPHVTPGAERTPRGERAQAPLPLLSRAVPLGREFSTRKGMQPVSSASAAPSADSDSDRSSAAPAALVTVAASGGASRPAAGASPSPLPQACMASGARSSAAAAPSEVPPVACFRDEEGMLGASVACLLCGAAFGARQRATQCATCGGLSHIICAARRALQTEFARRDAPPLAGETQNRGRKTAQPAPPLPPPGERFASGLRDRLRLGPACGSPAAEDTDGRDEAQGVIVEGGGGDAQGGGREANGEPPAVDESRGFALVPEAAECARCGRVASWSAVLSRSVRFDLSEETSNPRAKKACTARVCTRKKETENEEGSSSSPYSSARPLHAPPTSAASAASPSGPAVPGPRALGPAPAPRWAAYSVASSSFSGSPADGGKAAPAPDSICGSARAFAATGRRNEWRGGESPLRKDAATRRTRRKLRGSGDEREVRAGAGSGRRRRRTELRGDTRKTPGSEAHAGEATGDSTSFLLQTGEGQSLSANAESPPQEIDLSSDILPTFDATTVIHILSSEDEAETV